MFFYNVMIVTWRLCGVIFVLAAIFLIFYFNEIFVVLKTKISYCSKLSSQQYNAEVTHVTNH